jgi:hypothetical protein
MNRVLNIKKYIKICAMLAMLFLFLGCQKESPCRSVVQGDWELVP